jgi:thiamine biosynthesis lipoprotein
MGTSFEAYLFGDDQDHLEAVAVAALAEIRRLDRTLSRFDPRSEISRINREAVERPVRIDCEVFALLEQCEQARLETGGYFDVTAKCGGGGLVLDPDACSIRLPTPGATIDLGGVGKGYALDRAREILTKFGIENGMLNGGSSSVLALGRFCDGGEHATGWSVDLRHPMDAEAPPIARLELRNRALSCSAIRGHDQEPTELLNPLTGRPLAGDAACVTLASSAAEAEIYSTALLAMGVEKTIEFVDRNSNAAIDIGWFSEGYGFYWIRETLWGVDV